jgi:SAM-dependent methyltransferase
MGRPAYSTDLAYIHDAGFSRFAHRAAPEVIRILRERGIRRGLIVDIGCGTAPLAGPLIAAGYEVIGIDRSPAMIRLARARAPAARFRVGSLTTARLPRCDAAIALNEVINYVPAGRHSSLRTFFTHVHDALLPGGVFLFDFMASAEGRTYPAKSRAGHDWAIVVRASYDRATSVLTRDITTFRKAGHEYRKAHETHRITIYAAADIRRLLERAGFRVTMRRSYGRLRLLPGDLAVTAQKRRS